MPTSTKQLWQNRRPREPSAAAAAFAPLEAWFTSQGRKAFPFQRQVWQAMATGTDGRVRIAKIASGGVSGAADHGFRGGETADFGGGCEGVQG